MENIKLKIKLGSLDFEYEGAQDFFKAEFSEVFGEVLKKIDNKVKKTDEEFSDDSQGSIDLSVSTIASKLNVGTGPELIIAACASLQIVEKRESYSRGDILKKAQSAKSFYKSTYGKNLSQYLKSSVTNKKLLENGSNQYSLAQTTLQELKSTLSA